MKQQPSVCIDVTTGGNTEVFRIGIADEILRLLADAHETEFTIPELVGVVVFGSVARGEADRQSDIDLFVVVEGDRTSARRLVTDVVSDLGEQRFDGDRFAFEPYVETIDSATRAGSKLREVFDEGITAVGDERLESIRKAVFADE
jgi:predicted nucleotidyltransferase